MKRFGLFAVLMLGLFGVSKADFLTGGNLRDKNVSVHYSTTPTTTIVSTSIILIDLSSTTVWPHRETGQININSIACRIDKLAASSCTVKIGVVTHVDASSGTVKWFYSSDNLVNVSNTDVNRYDNPDEVMYRLRVEGANLNTIGTTPFLFTNDTSLRSTTYQNDINLPTSASTYNTPGVGDVILYYEKANTATATIAIDLQYTTDRR